MREIMDLEPAPEDAGEEEFAEAASWGVPQRLILLGAMLAALAVLLALGLYAARPKSRFGFDPDEIRKHSQKLAPAQTWEYWGELKKGLDIRTDQEYENAFVRFMVWEGVCGALFVIGGALAAAGAVKAGGRRAAAPSGPAATPRPASSH
jgi:hypothetical protein